MSFIRASIRCSAESDLIEFLKSSMKRRKEYDGENNVDENENEDDVDDVNKRPGLSEDAVKNALLSAAIVNDMIESQNKVCCYICHHLSSSSLILILLIL